MFPLPQAMLMSGSDTLIIFRAPLNSSTTSTDVTASPLAATVSGSGITYTSTAVDFNTLATPGGPYPTITWGTGGVANKLSTSLYPTKKVVATAYANVLQYVTGSGANSDACSFLKLNWTGGGATVSAYVTTTGISLLTSYSTNSGTSSTLTYSAFPTGEHQYSIEWTVGNLLVWKLDDTIIRVSNVTRSTNPATLAVTSSTGYKGTFYGGVTDIALRELVYSATKNAEVYTWTDTGYFGTSSFSNNCQTITCKPTGTGTSVYSSASVPITSGRVYCEFAATARPAAMPNSFGVQSAPIGVFYNAGGSMFSGNGGCGLASQGLYLNGTSVSTSSIYSFGVNDRIGIAFDADTKKIWFSKNGTWLQGDPAAGTNPSLTLTTAAPYYFTMSTYSCNITSGNFSYTIYPDAATQLNSPPTGFSRYQPD